MDTNFKESCGTHRIEERESKPDDVKGFEDPYYLSALITMMW